MGAFRDRIMSLTPRLFWEMNDGGSSTIIDSSGNGFNGVATGAVGLNRASMIPNNPSGYSAEFIRGTSNIVGPLPAAMATTTIFSVLAVIKCTDVNGVIQTIASRHGSSTGNSAWTFRVDTPNKLYFYVWRDNNSYNAILDPDVLEEGRTYLVSAVFEGTPYGVARYRIYKDGVDVVNAVTAANAPYPGTSAFSVGNTMGPIEGWGGGIQSVAYFTTAISAADQALLWTDFNAPPLTEPPMPPRNLSRVITSTTAELRWDDPAWAGMTDYDVRVDGGSTVDVNLDHSYQVTGLTQDTDHLMEVRARNAAGISAWQSMPVHTTPTAYTIPWHDSVLTGRTKAWRWKQDVPEDLIYWWTGSFLAEVACVGVKVSGLAVEPLDIKGWWDGAGYQPVA